MLIKLEYFTVFYLATFKMNYEIYEITFKSLNESIKISVMLIFRS